MQRGHAQAGEATEPGRGQDAEGEQGCIAALFPWPQGAPPHRQDSPGARQSQLSLCPRPGSQARPGGSLLSLSPQALRVHCRTEPRGWCSRVLTSQTRGKRFLDMQPCGLGRRAWALSRPDVAPGGYSTRATRTRPHRGRELRCRLPPRPRRPRHWPVTVHSRICPPHPSSCPRCAAETGVRVRHHQSCGTPVTPHAREGLPRGPAHARRLALMTRKPQNSIFHLQPPARDPVPAACALTLSQEPLSHQLPGHRAGDTVTAPSGWTVPCWSAAGRPGGPVGGTRHSPTLLPCGTSPQPPRCPRIVLWYRGSRSLEQPSRRRHVPGPRCLATARHNPGNRRPVSAKACVSTASAPRPREPGRSGPGQCQPPASPPAPLRPPLACPAPEHVGPRPEGPPVGPATRVLVPRCSCPALPSLLWAA